MAGAAWTVPVLQTALAPMASASPGTMTGQPCTNPTGDEGKVCGDGISYCHAGYCGSLGALCVANGANPGCVSGLCAGGTCKLPYNAICTTNSDCASGSCRGRGTRRCATGGSGTYCATNADCTNGNCQNGVCGGLGATCTGTGTTQCAMSGGQSVYCSNGTCGGVGAVCASSAQCNGRPCSARPGGNSTCGGPRAACTTNAQCTYNNCAAGICGGTGATCTSSAQCASAIPGPDCVVGHCLTYTP